MVFHGLRQSSNTEMKAYSTSAHCSLWLNSKLNKEANQFNLSKHLRNAGSDEPNIQSSARSRFKVYRIKETQNFSIEDF